MSFTSRCSLEISWNCIHLNGKWQLWCLDSIASYYIPFPGPRTPHLPSYLQEFPNQSWQPTHEPSSLMELPQLKPRRDQFSGRPVMGLSRLHSTQSTSTGQLGQSVCSSRGLPLKHLQGIVLGKNLKNSFAQARYFTGSKRGKAAMVSPELVPWQTKLTGVKGS